MEFKKLYKRSTTGKISEWQIFVEGNAFWTVSGFSDGLKITSDKTVCEGKSYNSSEEQALKQATAIHKKKMELGAFEKVEDIDKPVYFSPMLAKDYKNYKTKVKYPLASSVKLDGVRCILKSDGMWSRNGKELISAPHIFESIKHIFDIYPNIIFDGELYAEKDVCDFNTIISCVRKTKPIEEDLELSKGYIKYYIYDLPNIDDLNYSYKERLNKLEEILSKENNPNLQLVGYELVNNEQEVNNLLSQYISEGFEGQILRILYSEYENKRSAGLMKHKNFLDSEYEIIGVKEGIGKLSGKVGTLLFDRFESAVNGTHEYLEELWQNRESLIGLKATVKYFELTTDQIPRFPKVIQIDRSWE